MKMPLSIITFVVVLGILGIILFATKNNSTPAELSTVPSKTVESQNMLSADEEKQILDQSNTMIKANTEKGYKYTVAIKKHVGNFVRVDVTPAKGEMIDPAQVILEKKDGMWVAVNFGTSFPDMYDKVPELFR